MMMLIPEGRWSDSSPIFKARSCAPVDLTRAGKGLKCEECRTESFQEGEATYDNHSTSFEPWKSISVARGFLDLPYLINSLGKLILDLRLSGKICDHIGQIDSTQIYN